MDKIIDNLIEEVKEISSLIRKERIDDLTVFTNKSSLIIEMVLEPVEDISSLHYKMSRIKYIQTKYLTGFVSQMEIQFKEEERTPVISCLYERI